MPAALYAFGVFHLDLQQRLLLRAGKPVPLAPKAVQILCILVENRGKLVERTELMSRVWPGAFVEEGNLTVHIFALRKALADGLDDAPAIETVPKRGYRFVAPVQEIDQQSPATAASRTSPGLSRIPKLAIVSAALAVSGVAALLLLPARSPHVASVAQLTHFGLAEALGSDGVHLFAGQKTGGRFGIVQVSDGGTPSSLALPFPNPRLLDVSAARQELLVASVAAPGEAPSVWIVPTTGGAPQRLAGIHSSSARWSPDGTQIAYETGGAIYIAVHDGSNARKIVNDTGTPDAWSRDGRRLRFTRTNEATGGQSIWEVRADGSGLKPVLPERRIANARWGEGQCCGRWTPDGRYFLFREAIGASSALWALPETDSVTFRRAAPVKLYAAAFEIRDPVVSADGKRLLLVGVNETRELVRFDRRLRQWVPIPLDPAADFARWSPDHQWISYETFPDRILWRSRADGSERRQLTFPPMQAFGGVWSPDGRQFAFHMLAPGKPGKICLLPADGGEPRVLLAGESTGEDSPTWSPDGGTLLFARYWLDKNGVTTSGAICRFDLRTGQAVALPGTENLGPPSASPDGRYIAAQSDDFHHLMLFDSHTGKWSEIAHGSFIHAPQWTRDSRSIFYQDRSAGEEQPVYRVTLPGLEVERVAGRRQFLRADVARFALAAMTPDDEPVAAVIHSNADIYSLALDWR
jgi:DNA-binding winged helix-turn-helix (wHTH) protein/Tol biopolymer transport system component